MILFTSDWHLGHERIIELCGRPFDDVDTMNEWLIEAANRDAEPHDTIIFLGDAAMGKIDESLPLFKRIRARKVLKPGNHDRCSPLYHQKHPERHLEWIARYEEAGFTVVNDNWFTGNGFEAVLSHFPYSGDTQDTDRYADARPIDKGDWLLHGHTHGMWRQRAKQIDVGVDAWGGHLVSATMIAALIQAGPALLDPLPWMLW